MIITKAKQTLKLDKRLTTAPPISRSHTCYEDEKRRDQEKRNEKPKIPHSYLWPSSTTAPFFFLNNRRGLCLPIHIRYFQPWKHVLKHTSTLRHGEQKKNTCNVLCTSIQISKFKNAPKWYTLFVRRKKSQPILHTPNMYVCMWRRHEKSSPPSIFDR